MQKHNILFILILGASFEPKKRSFEAQRASFYSPVTFYGLHRRYFLCIIWLTLSILTVWKLNGDTIAVFYALDVDAQELSRNSLKQEPLLLKGKTKVIHLRLGRHELFLAKMGVGCVETTKAVQAVFNAIKCNIAFSIGPAGNIASRAPLGQWYKVDSIIAYQVGTATASGMTLKPYGKFVSMPIPYDFRLPPPFQNAQKSVLASGETFIASSDFRAQIAAETGAQIVDMNLFGLASVCADYNVPWVAWKISSDYADEHASENFKEFTSEYNGAGGTALAELIRMLPESKISLDSYRFIQKVLEK